MQHRMAFEFDQKWYCIAMYAKISDIVLWPKSFDSRFFSLLKSRFFLAPKTGSVDFFLVKITGTIYGQNPL